MVFFATNMGGRFGKRQSPPPPARRPAAPPHCEWQEEWKREAGGPSSCSASCARDRSVGKEKWFFFREICCCRFCLLSLSGVCGEKTFSTVVGAYSRAHALEIVFISAPCLSLVGGTVLVFSNNQYDLVDKNNSGFFCLLANGRWSILVIFLGKK